MTTIEIARKMAALGQGKDACRAYTLAIGQNLEPLEELEAAVYILQSGGNYKISFSALVSLYKRGHFKEDCLSVMTHAFYEPNVKLLKRRYQENCKLLSKYPYLFRRDFVEFEELPILFLPFDDNCYVPFFIQEQRFGDPISFRKPVVSRNFFKDLEKPVLAQDVFSQYELEYLNDNVRKSEYVARENHIYLHYTDWSMFCAYLQCLNLKRVLEDKKFVFLIEKEVEQYPIDFKARFGIDYSQYTVKPVGIREVNRMIWHTQLSYHNGGDFFNEIFDGHPNLLATPSIMFSNIEDVVRNYRELLKQGNDSRQAVQQFGAWEPRLVDELCRLHDCTDKDILVAMYLGHKQIHACVDPAARIVPAIFFQPHFHSMNHELYIDSSDRTVLMSEEYEQIRTSPLFQKFKYIKTFSPMRCITTSYGATVKFLFASAHEEEEDGKKAIVPDAVSSRVLNRSFMIDEQDRLFADSILVRFEDGKLNPIATFTALAAFLDLPYTESMTYCSLFGERDPESLKGNDLGFSTAAIYRTYDEYANDAERTYIEYFMRDAYEYYGYDFRYYDGQPMDEERIKYLVDNFTTIDHYIRESWSKNVYAEAELTVNGERASSELEEKTRRELMEQQLEAYKENRLRNAMLLQRGLRFVSKNGQPLHMMPLLKLDPALLEQPLYH